MIHPLGRYLVTGATSGVGREVVRRLFDAECSVDVVGRDPVRLASLIAFRPGCEAHVVDFATVEPIDVTSLLRSRGAYDGIFHAAGHELVLPLRLMDDLRYRQMMTYVDSSFAILRAAGSKGVLKDGGSVVLMSSVAATRGTAGMGAYSASRAAVEALARVSAVELANRRIRVNCIAAGAFESALHDRVTKRMPAAAVDDYKAAHPLGFGVAGDVADAAMFLLGPSAGWVTGSTMVVDGGYLA